MLKYFIILNPSAAKGAALKLKPELEQALNEKGLDYHLVVSEHPGQPIVLAKKACDQNYDVIVSVGGDGTANEIINGLMAAKTEGKTLPKLGLIPAGRGNDFAGSMGVPPELKSAVDVLVAGKSNVIDIGEVIGGDYPNGKYFGNGIGIGFDTVVGFEAAKLPSFLSGTPGYIIAALKTIFLYFNAPLLRIKLDDQELEMPCLIVSVMNGIRMGGTFMMAPESKPDDGLFSLMIVSQTGRIEVLKLITKIMSGTHVGHPKVSMPLSSSLEITALNGSLPVHADGETICEQGNSLRVRMHPKQIELITGK